jgi:hypothetical protein
MLKNNFAWIDSDIVCLKNFESKKNYYSAVSVSTLDEMHPHKIQKINKKKY